jgi:hypothetical protein
MSKFYYASGVMMHMPYVTILVNEQDNLHSLYLVKCIKQLSIHLRYFSYHSLMIAVAITEPPLVTSDPACDLGTVLLSPFLAADLRLSLSRHDSIEPEHLERAGAAAGEAALARLRLFFHVHQALIHALLRGSECQNKRQR